MLKVWADSADNSGMTFTIATQSETIKIQAYNNKSAIRIARKALGETEYYLFAHDGLLLDTNTERGEAPCAGLD